MQNESNSGQVTLPQLTCGLDDRREHSLHEDVQTLTFNPPLP